MPIRLIIRRNEAQEPSRHNPMVGILLWTSCELYFTTIVLIYHDDAINGSYSYVFEPLGRITSLLLTADFNISLHT